MPDAGIRNDDNISDFANSEHKHKHNTNVKVYSKSAQRDQALR